MPRANEMIAIFVLLNLSQLRDINAVKTSLKHSFIYPDKQVMSKDDGFEEGTLVYAVCDPSMIERTCVIIQREFPYDQIKKSCNITLTVEYRENDSLSYKVYVLPFGKDKVIMLWGESGSLPIFNLMTIELDSCKSNLVELDDGRIYEPILSQQFYSKKILTYDNYFDIFINGEDMPSGINGSQVRMRVNLEGKTDEQTVSIKHGGKEVNFISTVAAHSPAKGYVYSRVDRHSYTLLLIKPDGSEKILSQKNFSFAMSSVKYDVITTCNQPELNSTIECIQFDENGEIKFGMTLANDDKENLIVAQTVVNSSRGGFLMFIATFNKNTDRINYRRASSYSVIRVNKEGRKVGSLHFDGIAVPYQPIQSFYIWEKENEYCAASIGQAFESTNVELIIDNLHIAVNCFDESDFLA